MNFLRRNPAALIPLAIVAVGLLRYWGAGAIRIGVGPQRIITAMAAGSIVGAALGGLGVAYAPASSLKVSLGCVLLAAAWRTAPAT